MVECDYLMKRLLTCVVLSLGLASCGETSSSTATCAFGPEFESSIVATGTAFEDFSKTTPRQLQSTMSVLLLSLSRMREVAPDSISASLERAERAYSEVSIALQAISWDTSIADSDPLVAQSLQVLARSETIEAMTDLREFFASSCKTELKALPTREVAGATTLPTPIGNIDPNSFTESSSDFDTEESALRAYGYYVADQVGEKISDDQALCVGTALLVAAESTTPVNDAQYDAFVIDAIASCVD